MRFDRIPPDAFARLTADLFARSGGRCECDGQAGACQCSRVHVPGDQRCRRLEGEALPCPECRGRGEAWLQPCPEVGFNGGLMRCWACGPGAPPAYTVRLRVAWLGAGGARLYCHGCFRSLLAGQGKT